MRRLIVALGLFLLPVIAQAQEQRTFVRTYDLAATSYIYCATSVPFEVTGARATTVLGGSTTVTAVLPTDAFRQVAVGDDLVFSVDGNDYLRRVTAKASNASLTVDSAVTLRLTTGSPFSIQTRSCGTAVTDGWINVQGWTDKMVKLEAAALTGTGGVTWSIECRLSGNATAPIQLVTGNMASTTVPVNGDTVVVPEPCSDLRVGLKWGTADGAGPDSVSAYVVGAKRSFQ
jgi:hypothetical protein